MAASLTFAQAPLAKKKAATVHRLERIADMDALVKKAKEAKELHAVMAEKAAVAKETSSSVLRKSNVKRGYFNSIDGTALKTWRLDGKRVEAAAKPYKSTARKTTTQEGNVTVTTDENGIITDVAGVEPKMYQRAAPERPIMPPVARCMLPISLEWSQSLRMVPMSISRTQSHATRLVHG